MSRATSRHETVGGTAVVGRYLGVMAAVTAIAVVIWALALSIIDSGPIGVGTLLFLPYAMVLVAVQAVPAAIVGTLLGLTALRITRGHRVRTRIWTTAAASAVGMVGPVAAIQVSSELEAVSAGFATVDPGWMAAAYVVALIVITLVLSLLCRYLVVDVTAKRVTERAEMPHSRRSRDTPRPQRRP